MRQPDYRDEVVRSVMSVARSMDKSQEQDQHAYQTLRWAAEKRPPSPGDGIDTQLLR